MHTELAKKIEQMMPILNEKQLRRYLGSEAEALGRGGIAIVSKISGKSRNTIVAGIKENNMPESSTDRVRKSGGGRKSIKEKYPNITEVIESIVTDSTFGNPENPLIYTTKSTRKIMQILNEKEYEIGHNVVADILEELGYSLQLNQKMLQVGEEHPDRDIQFKFINEKVKLFLNSGDPVISIDAKKKELVGNFKNNGSVYNKSKNPTKVLDHDFPLKELGKVTPYGVYDINRNEGFVNLGVSKDTAEFAVESLSRWWLTVGKNTYSQAKRLYINCDGGGSNGARNRLFKSQLQEFADQSQLEVHVSHFPPGTSKWNKVEHRLFCFISSNWRGQPLLSVETIISLIGSTTTTTGLKVICVKDDNKYEIGIKVSDDDFEKINIEREKLCPDWNYIIHPTK
jgi:Rhodopirellula transposase.